MRKAPHGLAVVPLVLGLALLSCSPARGDEGGVDAGAADADPLCATGIGPFPRPLELPGAEPNGVYDANLARDPTSGRLWMAYSGVSGPGGSGFVSTHLAYSDDDGTTWCDRGTINAAAVVPESDQPARIAGPEGHWNHEVPALAYDAEAPAERRWTLIWHRYLHVADDNPATDDRRFEYGWIAIRSAATIDALIVAPERKLFSSRAYHALPEVEAYNEAVVGGSPEKRWDVDRDLGGCLVFTEPGVLAANGKLYAALFCFRSAERQEIVLVGFSHQSAAWSYLGTLLTTEDAVAIDAALLGLNAPDLYQVGSSTRLIVSPTADAYLGCIEYALDLTTAALADSNGDGPDPLLAIPKNPDVFQTGACTYQEGIATGIILGDAYFSAPQFRLVATGQVP